MEALPQTENSTAPIYIEKAISEQQLLQSLSQNFNAQFESLNFQKDESDYFVMVDLNENGFLVDLMITWQFVGGKLIDSKEIAYFIATTFKTNVVFENSTHLYEFEYTLFDENGNAFKVEMLENYDEDENVFLKMDEVTKKPIN